ncbi:DNA ligase D [Marinobacter fonticola]|uniref:DNA ligase D n=1 Tax=Marinobacter fonticola TaxID=2603215 RepID=UPI0011E79880|nr:DNA ligase D [Marinobacter fonticola]
MPDSLKAYRDKRNFERSPEPQGQPAQSRKGNARYVMHKHAASHEHFDLRLEQAGVLRSWALPKGPSLARGEKRLAVEVEDHPLAYGDFEGVIPRQEYGGGTVMLWDTGTWRPLGKPSADRIDLELHGSKLTGRWSLVRTSSAGSSAGKSREGRQDRRQWLLIKRTDPARQPLDPDDLSIVSGRSMDEIAADKNRVWTAQLQEPAVDPAALPDTRKQALIDRPAPQLAVLKPRPPKGDQWLHELKFDGYRLMARLDLGDVALLTRNGKDWTHRFPELVDALGRLPVDEAIIDGEIVIFDQDGTTSFRKLQDRVGGVGGTVHDAGLVLQVFDLLHLDGYNLMRTPLTERKAALKAVLEARPDLAGGAVRYSDHILGHGAGFLREVCDMRLEGIISKQVDARYRPGRQESWVKSKCTLQDEFVVGGYTPPSGARTGFGSLLLGAFGSSGFEYQGRVGAGFSSHQIGMLRERLQSLSIERRPFAQQVPDSKGAQWVQPELVVDVEYAQRSARGVLRQPVFRGLRDDKTADEITTQDTAPSVDSADTEQAKSAEGSTRRTTAEGPTRNSPGPRGVRIAGVAVSHADRVVFPEVGLTKRAIAQYLDAVAEWMLPHVGRRPLAMVRCPDGWTGDCFFQKRPGRALAGQLPQVTIAGNSGDDSDFVYVETARDLVYLAQTGVLELHPWGSRIEDVETPDTVTFDFDPDPSVPWSVLAETVHHLGQRLARAGLTGFPRTTGGKGLHVVVPIEPEADWEVIKQFARVVANIHAQEQPQLLTTHMAKARRKGRIFIDYLRNGRGATSVASYSIRAREGAPVATPLRWDEVTRVERGDRYTVKNLFRRLRSLKDDPWEGFEQARRPLTVNTLEKLESNR